jgi:predicted DNA-binding transcriptional regulator AlpA
MMQSVGANERSTPRVWLSVNEAADHVGVDQQTIYRWMWARRRTRFPVSRPCGTGAFTGKSWMRG